LPSGVNFGAAAFGGVVVVGVLGADLCSKGFGVDGIAPILGGSTVIVVGVAEVRR